MPSLGGAWQDDVQGRSPLGLVCGVDVAAMGGHDRAADGQAEPEPLRLGRHEGLEDPLQIGAGYAWALIRDLEVNGAWPVQRGSDPKRTVRLGDLSHAVASVEHEVQQHLLQLHAIA